MSAAAPPGDAGAAGRFVWKPGDVIFAQCNSCKHNHWDLSCTAFASISLAILGNEVDHRKSVEGDHGYQWEPRDDKSVHPLETKQ